MANNYIPQNDGERVLWALDIIDKLPFYAAVLQLSDAEAAETLSHCYAIVACIQQVQTIGHSHTVALRAKNKPQASDIQYLRFAGMSGEW